MSPTSNWAGDLTGRALESYETFDTDSLSSSGLDQTYELRLRRQLTPTLHLRLSGRLEDVGGSNEMDLSSLRRDYREWQPGGELVYTLPGFQLQGTYDRIQTNASLDGGVVSDRLFERDTGRLTWRRQGLPGLTLQSERRNVADDEAALDQTETLHQAALDYAFKGLTASALARRTLLDDDVAHFSRRALEEQGTLAFNHQAFHGGLTTSADVLVSTTGLDESAGLEAASIPTAVSIATASYASDDTPLDSADHPATPIIELTDGNTERSASIPLGPDGASFQNLVLDLGRYSPLDEVYVHVRDADGKRPLVGGPVTWDVYISTDGQRWAPVASTGSLYSAARGVYDIRFARTTTRLLKVVSFGTNLQTTNVTEVQAFYHTGLAPGETRHTDLRLGSGTVTVVARPRDTVNVSYYGLVNTLRQSGSMLTDVSNTSADHLFTLTVDPLAILNLIARYERRTIRPGDSVGQAFDVYSGVARLRPAPGLQESAELTRTIEDDAGRKSQTDGLTLHSSMRLYRTLDIQIDAGLQSQEYPLVGVADGVLFRAHRRLLGVVTQAQLTRSLKLTLQGNLQRNRYEGATESVDPETALLLPDSDDRWTVEVFFSPSPQLALAARLGRATTKGYAVTLQRYHFDWHPFAGGSLRLGGMYDLDVDSVGHRQARRVTLSPAWTINRRTMLTVNYSRLEILGDQPSNATAFVATLSLTL